MGYHTSYSLTLSPDTEENWTRFRQIQQKPKHEHGIGWALDESGDTNDSIKWYEHHKDMKEVSLEMPDVLFTLSGSGEESGDIWRAYYLNGKVQMEHAQIVVAPFDPAKLRDFTRDELH